jgi:hypothetical protein
MEVVERSWLGCGGMVMNKMDAKVKKLLIKEGFDNEELFYADYETFEEIPLFSRWHHIEFLKNRTLNDNNLLLISNAIGLSENANSIAREKLGDAYSEYFCCVTLTQWDCVGEINCITPNLYITRRKSWLFSYVKLHKTNSKEEVVTTQYINSLGVLGYGVYTSNLVDGSVNRVYIVNENAFHDVFSL